MKVSFTRLRILNPLLLTLVTFFAGLVPLAGPVEAQAVDAGATYMRCARMKTGVAPGSCLIVFTTSSTTATETTIKLTLDSEWVSATNFSATATDYTVSTTGIPSTSTAMPGISTADLVSGNTIRFPVTALANSTEYAFFITGTGLLLNPAASTTQLHTIFTRTGADAATADTQTVAVPTIADDQIVLTATIDPTFTFVFGNNAQSLGTLSTGSVTSGGGTTVTVSTNAATGWNMWVLSSGAALTSAGSSGSIGTTGSIDAAPSTLSAGTAGYVLDADLTTDAASGGTVSIAAEYLGTTTSAGGTLSTSYQLVASSNGPANGDVITLVPRVAISGLTPAATDYTDTLTVVGAGIF